MRIHTPKLKGPHPLAVLAFCLLWPVAAMVGAITRHDNPPEQVRPAAASALPATTTAKVATQDTPTPTPKLP